MPFLSIDTGTDGRLANLLACLPTCLPAYIFLSKKMYISGLMAMAPVQLFFSEGHIQVKKTPTNFVGKVTKKLTRSGTAAASLGRPNYLTQEGDGNDGSVSGGHSGYSWKRSNSAGELRPKPHFFQNGPEKTKFKTEFSGFSTQFSVL